MASSDGTTQSGNGEGNQAGVAAADTVPLGRFEIRHREVDGAKGELIATVPQLDTNVFFEAGASITDTNNLSLSRVARVEFVTLLTANGRG